MGESVFRRESAVEYFKELVEGALEHQHVSANALTSFYVVQMLTGFLQRRDACEDGPLGIRLARALEETADARRRTTLRQIGDSSLFISGFFSDSLRRRLVDVDYYVHIGGVAYNALSRQEHTFSPVFAELAAKFVEFVDVISEVSERSSCSSNADLLRLYEKWLKTRSTRSGQLLVERGVVPNPSIDSSSRIQ